MLKFLKEKAQLAAARAEARTPFAEAKMTPQREAMMQKERDEAIAAAREREAAAHERIENARK